MCQHLRIRTARNRYSNHWPLLVTFRLLLSRVKTEGFQSVCLTALKEVLWSRKYEKRHKPYNIGGKKKLFSPRLASSQYSKHRPQQRDFISKHPASQISWVYFVQIPALQSWCKDWDVSSSPCIGFSRLCLRLRTGQKKSDLK